VLSIAVGVFGLGVIAGARSTLSSELHAAFIAIEPASATITTVEPFGQDLVDAVAKMPEVEIAEGRRSILARVEVSPGDWRDLQLNVIPDFEAMALDLVRPVRGEWPPPERGLILERTAVPLIGANIGDTVTLEMPDGRRRSMPVVGTAHDLYAQLYALDGVGFGYIRWESLDWLGQSRSFNELRIIPAENRDDRRHVDAVTRLVRDKVEAGGLTIFLMTVPEPGVHPLDTTVQAILLLLGVMGVLALVLSGLLVTNTVSALVIQETRQIGIMKTIGARRLQIVGMYLALVVAFGVLALLVAAPLSAIGTHYFASLVAGFLNFDIPRTAPPLWVFALQAAVALSVPLIAALPPVLRGARLSVREAIAEYGLGRGRFGKGRAERWFQNMLEGWTFLHEVVSRPVLLSLRNTFRRKGRLALTLTTLSIAGAIFIGIFSARDSLLRTVQDVLGQLWRYDLWVLLEKPARSDILEAEAMRVPGIVNTEGWGFASTRLVRQGDDSLGGSMFGFIIPTMLFAPPAETDLLAPVMLRGRWLVPEDDNALVVNTEVLKQQPGLDLGDTVTLKLGGRDTDWRIVGVAQAPLPSPMVFANYPYYARVTDNAGRAATLMAVTEKSDLKTQLVLGQRLEDQLQRAGIEVMAVAKIAQEMSEVESTFGAIVNLLLMVAVLLAVVGGLGLMGTMSLNVIERTREMGVMRATGASTTTILRIVLTEGALIGAMSWLIGLALSVPLAWLLGTAIGNALFQVRLSLTFSTSGALLWLAVVMTLSVVASLLPAWSATRVSVRESLAYE